jgi:hypothetical protein
MGGFPVGLPERRPGCPQSFPEPVESLYEGIFVDEGNDRGQKMVGAAQIHHEWHSHGVGTGMGMRGIVTGEHHDRRQEDVIDTGFGQGMGVACGQLDGQADADGEMPHAPGQCFR